MRCRRKYVLAKIVIIAGFLSLLIFMQHCIKNRIPTSMAKYSKSRSKFTNCEVIHIGVVCTGYTYNVHFYSMLKSLYYVRNNPLHFHLIVDDVSEEILRTMFETWAVQQVNMSFYNVKTLISEMWWIQAYQYDTERLSKLLKFIFPQLISANIANMIIVLDANTIFVSDIRNLWNVFHNFKKKQAIGFVRKHNNDYLRTFTQQSNPVDDVAEGQTSYNADVLLYNLKRLEENKQAEKLIKIINTTISGVGETKVTDQDVVNAILETSYNLVYCLPGYWIYQLESDYGYYNTTKIKILSYPKPGTNLTNNDDNYEMYHKLLNYNGTLLRHRMYKCAENLEVAIPPNPKSDNCSDFHEAVNHHWRTLLFFRKFKYNVIENDLTFVSQLSYSRHHVVEELAMLWKGPISLTVYVTDSELHDFIEFIENSRFLRNRFNIAYYAVFKDGENHPINVLRNVALRHVITPYVFLVDIDFLPMPDLYLILKSNITNLINMENTALIVPAFETKNYLPKTKNQLLEMLDNSTLLPFHQKVYRRAHAPTNYQKWKTATDIYEVTWKSNFEPYIVVQKNVTKYDERFFGYGWNKVSHIMELKAQHYQFLVLPNVFIVHKPHKWSNDRHKFVKSRRQQKCLQKLKYRFMKELRKKYGN